MEIPEGHVPESWSASETREDWMDLVELKSHQSMDAARLEYAGIRDAIQDKHRGENAASTASTSPHLHDEKSAK